METPASVMHKGWFHIPGVQDGNRTIEQQLKGLETIEDKFPGRNVLDLGCAEGLIGKQCIGWGAASVDGVTAIQYEIDEAVRQCRGLPMRFFLCDLRHEDQCEALELRLKRSYNIVLLLSILHKTKQPMRLLEWTVSYATELVVIRLPAPVIDMERCRPGVHYVGPWMDDRFDRIGEPETCIEPVSGNPEWMGVYRVRL